jgi:transcriptional regulator GlxA family with amidase domain
MGAPVRTVTILGMYNTMASTVFGPMDIFYQAGVMWNFFQQKKARPYFDIRIATSDGKPLKCVNGAQILPDTSIADVPTSDLIVVSSIVSIDSVLRHESSVIDWLEQQNRAGAQIAAICTGAFVLAETGLLDGKIATTHWGAADEFRQRYPEVDLKPERLLTDAGDLFCSGGMNAGFDLCLYLVETYCGHEVAVQSAKAMVSDLGRRLQSPYSMLRFPKDHDDVQILEAQEWMETNYSQALTYGELASKVGLSRRSFERRFKAATGDTPLVYLQRIRVQAAKQMLETRRLSFDEVAYELGYSDSGSFRSIFRRHTGLLPGQYRRRFQTP